MLTLEFRNDSSFNGRRTTRSCGTRRSSDLTVTECGVITAGTLTLKGTTAGSGVFTLNTQNNAAGTVKTCGQACACTFGTGASRIDGCTSTLNYTTLQSNECVTQIRALAATR